MDNLDYCEFTSKPKSMLIAPAGHGKTHTIAECMKHVSGKQLILTHTHAGVSSIKAKLKKAGIASEKFNVETISSFAQKYALAFYSGQDLPSPDSGHVYYTFLISKAEEYLKLKPIAEILSTTYSGLFVDEYQDCTIAQHNLISVVAETLKTHILGDYLQGIFGFNGESLVDLQNHDSIGEFYYHQYKIETPWRWKGTNEPLGIALKQIRKKLEESTEINLEDFESIETHIVEENDLYSSTKTYFQEISSLLRNDNILIIHNDSANKHSRLKFVKIFNNSPRLIESMDDPDFYKLSEKLEVTSEVSILSTINSICCELFNKSEVKKWIKEQCLVRKATETDRKLIQPIAANIEQLKKKISLNILADTFIKISKLPSIKCYRKELFRSLIKSMELAECHGINVQEAMINQRNIIRRAGRNIKGRCIGTTLLTKGLEFDTVAILNAHKFRCPKHLYVAMTRASRRLIIFTKTPKLNPY